MGSVKRPGIFFEAGSWYHRVRILKDDGSTKYSKRGGFASAEEAEASRRRDDEDYFRAYRAFHSSRIKDFTMEDYLEYWLEETYGTRVEKTSYMLASYVIYDLLKPNMDAGIKLGQVSTDYLDACLARASRCCPSAGNKCRELLSVAMKDAVEQGIIQRNRVTETRA